MSVVINKKRILNKESQEAINHFNVVWWLFLYTSMHEQTSNTTPRGIRTPDLTGQIFDRLTVMSYAGKDKRNNSMWNCICTCGKLHLVRAFFLKNRQTKSCGCLVKEVAAKLNIKHGVSGHRLYHVLEGIKSRCNNPNANNADKYGLIGVKVCDEWMEHPIKFIEWALANGWKKGLQIDKDIIPRKLGIPAIIYSPQMCSVVTSKQNGNARTNNHRITYNGVEGTLAEWGAISGVSGKQIKRNLDKGWSIEESISNRRNQQLNN